MKTGYMAIVDKEDINSTVSGDRFTLQLFGCLEGNRDLFVMFSKDAIEELIEDYEEAKEVIIGRSSE